MTYDHKIIVFTDSHITEANETIIGLDPMLRFQQGLAHALERHPDAARIILTGDLAHHGTPKQYARLKEALSDCPVPVSLLLGNHDRRVGFTSIFPEAAQTSAGFIQSFVDIEGWRLIMLDTLDEQAPDHHSGWLCNDRLQWMEDALSSAGPRKRIVFTHHPTFITGFTGMDAIGLRNLDEVAERLSRHPNIRMIICGHVHRTILGATGGIPTAVLKSPCHQMPMLLDQPSWGDSVDEPGAYGILLLQEDNVVLHTEDFALSDGSTQDF